MTEPAVRRTHLQARLGRPVGAVVGWLTRPRSAMGTYGLELVMDLDVFDLAVIADGDKLQDYVEDLVDHIGMSAFGPPWIQHFGHGSPVTSGFTVFQPIETSSVVAHLSEGNLTAHLNVFSCAPFDTGTALDFTEAFFQNWRTTYTVINR